MAEHEGWKPPKSATDTASRSYRNHNPGNLRASPFAYSTIDGFAVFKNDALGWMALQWDIMQKAKGNTSTGLGPSSTLADLIQVWAPPTDGNDTTAYLAAVVQMSGLAPTTLLSELQN